MYQNILVAIDLYAENDDVIAKAIKLQKITDARLDIIYVSEPPISAYPIVAGLEHMTSEQGIKKALHPRMRELETKFDLAAGTIQIVFDGRPADEIVNRAKEQGVDLIILGSHGRHGLGLLLGSTATGVLHRATVDVLAVRVGS